MSEKVAPLARCSCVRRPSVPLRVFAAAARILRARLGELPAGILNLPLVDVRCREKGCRNNVPVVVGDLLGYPR